MNLGGINHSSDVLQRYTFSGSSCGEKFRSDLNFPRTFFAEPETIIRHHTLPTCLYFFRTKIVHWPHYIRSSIKAVATNALGSVTPSHGHETERPCSETLGRPPTSWPLSLWPSSPFRPSSPSPTRSTTPRLTPLWRGPRSTSGATVMRGWPGERSRAEGITRNQLRCKFCMQADWKARKCLWSFWKVH